MELSKTTRDASTAFSGEENIEESTAVGPQDDRIVPQFVMNTNHRGNAQTSKRSSSQDSRTTDSKRIDNPARNTTLKEERKMNNNPQQVSQDDIKLMDLVADIEIDQLGIEKLSQADTTLSLHTINELILNTVSSLTILGNETGYQLIECELLSQNNIPEAFAGVNMRLEQEHGELRISFSNFGSPSQIDEAYNLVTNHSIQLSSLIDSLNKKSFLLKEFKIGHQVVQLPHIEEPASPLNMIAANFKYYDDRQDKQEDESQQQFSSYKEELEQIEEV